MEDWMDMHLTDVVGIKELASAPRSTASGILPSKVGAVDITSK